MEDIKDLMDRLKKRIISGGAADKPELKRRLDVIYEIYAGAVGPEELIVRASRYGALKYIHHENLKKRLLGIERLVFESREYTEEPQEGEIPAILDRLEDRLAELLARRAVEERLERKISERLEEKHKEYVDEVKRELLEEDEDDVETAQSRHKMEKLEALDKISLTKTVMNVVKPGTLSEIVGQNDAVKALASKIASPYPQHLILYGPPGVGKTTAARLVLEEAKKTAWSAFGENAPFVECDGTTLRWDSRDITNPLIGSVHDPIYQGAQRELADDGIPEPKPGLVTDAHGGILFIDEIGELDPILLNKLLKVLEDKRVPFESAYYDEENPYVPAYIKKLFRDGAPADFILIGATTREPQEINPAIRSRCAEVFFEPLQPEDVETIVKNAVNAICLLPVIRSSDSTVTKTSIDERPAYITCALHVTSSPTSTGFLKLSSSTRAVTTFVWACFCAATPAALSIIFIISPPCTFPAGLACIGNTSCASIECECFIVCDSIMSPPYCTFLIIFSIFKHLLCVT